jgi:hypothetical protein
MVLVAATILGGPVGSHAHEFWLDASEYRPDTAAEITIYLRGGHYFPASALAPADRVIHRLTATSSAGTRDLSSTTEKRERRASLVISDPGLHRIDLVLQRPQLEKPDAWARLLLVPSGSTSDPAQYASGKGLEILPLMPIETARVGHSLLINVIRDGIALKARIQIVAAGGGVAWVDSMPEQPAAFTPRKPGRHLATVTDGGQTATLMFDVQP